MSKSIEVEVRIFLKNRKKIEENLRDFGSQIVAVSHLKDYWFCPAKAKDHKEASIDKTGFALRIRESKDVYSGKVFRSLDCKTLCDGKTHALCHEYEIDLSDIEQTRKIFESIGLKQFLLVDKQRTIYKYKNIKCYFDKIKGVGNGLEIEMMTNGDINKAHDRLIKFAKQIDIQQDEILDKSLTYIAMEKLARF